MKMRDMMVLASGLVFCLFFVSYGFSAEPEKDMAATAGSEAAHGAGKSILKPVRGVAAGVVGVGEGAKELVAQTVEETKSGKFIEGTVEGVAAGSKAMVDSTVRGAYRVATLGYGELQPGDIEHEAPTRPERAGGIGDQEGGKPSRFKINF